MNHFNYKKFYKKIFQTKKIIYLFKRFINQYIKYYFIFKKAFYITNANTFRQFYSFITIFQKNYFVILIKIIAKILFILTLDLKNETNYLNIIVFIVKFFHFLYFFEYNFNKKVIFLFFSYLIFIIFWHLFK